MYYTRQWLIDTDGDAWPSNWQGPHETLQDAKRFAERRLSVCADVHAVEIQGGRHDTIRLVERDKSKGGLKVTMISGREGA